MRAIAIVGITAWLAGVGLGIREIVAYSTVPGERAAAPAIVAGDGQRDTAYVFGCAL